MGHHVTIEGSVTPSVHLARGVRRTVAVTDHVRKLVKIGAVIVVAGSLDGPDPAETVPEAVWEPGDDPVLPELPEEAYAPGATPLEPAEPDLDDRVPAEPPGRNASRDDWAEWVAVNVPNAVTEGLSRDELRQIWDDFDGQR